ncbi:hypothetical protein L2E82_01066 [Cichorium intybus]|uniref:Uncharacterized protein n=1 Tax=Cichorium intybus TaxID=13427 RepID=A0ACB9GYX8_CICIN|nr:hypothetical protein L2E82_01066 [Cichorium intybus]
MDEKLQSVETKQKPAFTKKLLSKYSVDLGSLYKKLGEPNMVKKLREFYEGDGHTENIKSDRDFTKLMVLDGCFILYYILFIYGEKPENCQELRPYEIVFVHEDLFLVENQIPFKVLTVLLELIRPDSPEKFQSFFADNILAPERQKRGWFGFETNSVQIDEYDHLFHLLYCNLTSTSPVKTQRFIGRRRSNVFKWDTVKTTDRLATTVETNSRRTFHSVNELIKKGIRIKRSSTMHLTNVEFVKRCWWFSADLKLPQITMDRLLNLLAYELYSGDGYDHEWVISYICLLDSLIDQREDVTALREAGVLDNYPLGNESDKEVADLINTIGMYLVDPNNLACSKVKKQIRSHYDKWSSTHLTELMQDYLKSPWSLLAILTGVIVLFLSGVQTYFTVWSPKSECDDLCKFLKMNHHL